jgi:hypothetical protein
MANVFCFAVAAKPCASVYQSLHQDRQSVNAKGNAFRNTLAGTKVAKFVGTAFPLLPRTFAYANADSGV